MGAVLEWNRLRDAKDRIEDTALYRHDMLPLSARLRMSPVSLAGQTSDPDEEV